MRLGMPTLIDLGPLDRQVEACRALGLDFIELNTDLLQFQPDRLDAGAVRDVAARNGIEFTVHLPETLDLGDFRDGLRDASVTYFERMVRWSRDAGISLVNMHLHPGVYFTLPDDRVYVYARNETEYHERLIAAFEQIATIARDLDVAVCIENAGGWEQSFAQRALDTLVERGLAALTLDTGHAGAAAGAHDDVFRRHRDHISHMHLHDYSGTRNHLPLYTGNLDVDAALEFARGRDIRVVIEVKEISELKRSVEALRMRG